MSTDTQTSLSFSLEPVDNKRLAGLCGEHDENLRQVERRLGVEINNRGAQFQVIGHKVAIRNTEKIIQAMYDATKSDPLLTSAKIHLLIKKRASIH